ncbi:tyrosine-type recombinase/integrase [Leptospira interrogans]|uniref:tyrosine-type recombinase/integrase n=1 Tax=Leptospira interrogans TaxID=173 RepID=UPI0002BBC41D|nr:tyrosine-type recombinase/integrase [Leptospira interrogans]EMN52239.1 site-specific recombinase, phage integrase family [Leptospira interrogans serovar Autumnalis str. LP101]EMN70342.1 site-specific recombinase, phage integrase family [Leptospira interrogans serovar Bataviae str. UI 08561]EMN81306.1 site-specific recombinase, phage integrase family [Leptospira interrogans serovar Grippotyphosa str. UI 12764]EMO92211.1 site-specific recombinase, phage integrase family [Leptospira interrogans
MSAANKVVEFSKYRNKHSRDSRYPLQTEGSFFGKGLTDETMMELAKRFSNPSSEMEHRNRCLFLVMSTTGMRAKEVVSLRFSNILKAPSGETLVSYIRKGGKLSYSVISDKVLNSLKAYHSLFDSNSDYFFLSCPGRNRAPRKPLTTRGLQKIVNSWNVLTCLGKKIHPHALRHCLAQKLMDTGGGHFCSRVLNHSSPALTSKFYLRPYADPNRYLNWNQD